MSRTKKWFKSTLSKNRNSGNVTFSVIEKLGKLKAGQILAVYEPHKRKIDEYCRGEMTITQADIDAMELRENKEEGTMYYLMAYTLK